MSENDAALCCHHDPAVADVDLKWIWVKITKFDQRAGPIP